MLNLTRVIVFHFVTQGVKNRMVSIKICHIKITIHKAIFEPTVVHF